MTTRTKRKQDEVEDALQALPSDGSDEEEEEDYEEDFEGSEGDDDDEEEEEEDSAAAAVPAPIADEPVAASRPAKKRKLASPNHVEKDVQEIPNKDDARVAAGADGADDEEGEEDEEEEDYESENGGDEHVDLIPAGKRDVAKSNAKAPIKSAELVGNDEDDE